MLVRFFEYDAQIALDESEVNENVLTVEFPYSAVLFLRCSERTADSMKTRINTPGGSVEYDIHVIKAQRYSIDEIFEKGLLFLIPFYIFTHESRFEEYENDDVMLEKLKSEYEIIRMRLDELAQKEIINEYTKCTILDMSNKVLQNIAASHEKVREGVKAVMGGQVLDYEAKKIRNEGIEQGIERGIERGEAKQIIESVISLRKKLSISDEEACNLLDVSFEQYQSALILMEEK